MTSPHLALDAGRHIGRVYRHPSTPLPDGIHYDEQGNPSLRPRRAAELLATNLLFPSITNIIGARNAPHLVGWAARKTAEEAIRVAIKHPDLITEKPGAALEYLRGTADRDRDAAAEQGDIVHNACEDIARGLPCPTLSPEHRLYVDAWEAWCDRFQPEFLAIEATVFGHTDDYLPYAGTGDLIARINGHVTVVDYKTTRSGVHALDVAYQLSAIAHAREITVDDATTAPMLPVVAGAVLHLSQEGWQFVPAQLGGEIWSGFGALRHVWDAHVLDGGLRDGSRAVGRALARPEQLEPSLVPLDVR